MKHAHRHNFLIGFLLLTALFSLLPARVFAAGETIGLTPSSGSSQPGKTFTVSVDGHVSSTWAGGAYGVTGTVNFPANLLKVVDNGINTAGTPFTKSNTVTPDNNSGTISINQSNDWWNNVSNKDVHLFSITFQTLAKGTASVSFTNVKYKYPVSTANAASTGGTYTITSPPPSPSPTPKPTPKPTSTPKPSTTPKPSSSPKPTPTPSSTPAPEETPEPVVESDGGLKIENVKITTNRIENSVSWTVNNPLATPTFAYGTERGSQKNQGAVVKQEDGSYAVELQDLKLGKLYYFTIKAATADNLLGATYSGVLTTKGYPVQLTIEQNNLLIPGAKVIIDGRSFVANKNAIITTELGDGTFTAAITPPGEDKAQNTQFTVKKLALPNSGSPELQSFVLNITTVGGATGISNSLIPLVLGGAGTALALVGGGAGFLFYRKRKKEMEDATGQIDGDLLAASYGASVTERRDHTPAPNLETAPPPAMSMEAEAPASNETPQPEAPPMASIAANLAIDAAPANMPIPDPVSDPAFAPLPTIPDPVQAPPVELLPPEPEPPLAAQTPVPAAVSEPTGTLESVQQPTASTENNDPAAVTAPVSDEDANIEEYSQAVTSVESSEQSTESEPSAVYDEATGELEILHHHTATTASVQAASVPSNPSQQMTPETPPTVANGTTQFTPQPYDLPQSTGNTASPMPLTTRGQQA